MGVQAFRPQPSIERFNEGVVVGFPGREKSSVTP